MAGSGKYGTQRVGARFLGIFAILTLGSSSLIVGCGGSDGSEGDPDGGELDATFEDVSASDASIDSAKLDSARTDSTVDGGDAGDGASVDGDAITPDGGPVCITDCTGLCGPVLDPCTGTTLKCGTCPAGE
ncbi:MAG: hypothetical protein ABI175_25245, partial [Polyangiales bacterium]